MRVYIVQDEDNGVVKVFDTLDKINQWVENLDPNVKSFRFFDNTRTYRTSLGDYYVFPMSVE